MEKVSIFRKNSLIYRNYRNYIAVIEQRKKNNRVSVEEKENDEKVDIFVIFMFLKKFPLFSYFNKIFIKDCKFLEEDC